MSITGLILCGGRGQRVDGRDKGLSEWHGHPLAWYTAKRLRAQIDTLLISCNRNAERYRTLLGCDVIADTIAGSAGPLLAALDLCRTRLLLVCPTDPPLLPLELADKLSTALRENGAQIAAAHDGHRRQNLFFLMPTAQRSSLRRYCLEQGRKQVAEWLIAEGAIDVAFGGNDRQLGESPFFNCNDPQELRRLEAASGATAEAATPEA